MTLDAGVPVSRQPRCCGCRRLRSQDRRASLGADCRFTNALASKLGIFRAPPASRVRSPNRDNAPGPFTTPLDIEMIEKYENGYAIGFKDYRTIPSTMYGVYKLEGR